MPQFNITNQIDAPVADVWAVLDQFGDIARWSKGVKASSLTSPGPVGEGSTRHCEFAPFGAVNERIGTYILNERMEVELYETFKLPISNAVADFHLSERGEGTELEIRYNYTPNRLGRLARKTTEKQMRRGMVGLADDIKQASEHPVVP